MNGLHELQARACSYYEGGIEHGAAESTPGQTFNGHIDLASLLRRKLSLPAMFLP